MLSRSEENRFCPGFSLSVSEEQKSRIFGHGSYTNVSASSFCANLKQKFANEQMMREPQKPQRLVIEVH